MQVQSAPQTIEAFQQRLLQRSDRLPKRLRQCADYLAANADRIAVSTVAELASAANVQPSAVMRFCQIMGFSGFSDMQRLFRDSYAGSWPDYATRLENLRQSGAGSPAALLAEFVDASRKSLENLTNTIDPPALDQAVRQLCAARLIHIIGRRRAFPVASYLAYAFEKMEAPALLHDGVGNLDCRHTIAADDVLIAITFAPYGQTTVDLAVDCRRRGVPVVAITDTVMSPLRQIDVLPLLINEADFGAFRSLSATLSLAMTLAVAVGASRI